MTQTRLRQTNWNGGWFWRFLWEQKAVFLKTLLEQKHRLNFLYFPQNTLMLTESREEFSDLHSIFRLRALRYYQCGIVAWFDTWGLVTIIIIVKKYIHSCRTAFTISIVFQGVRSFEVWVFEVWCFEVWGLKFRGLSFRENRDHTI